MMKSGTKRKKYIEKTRKEEHKYSDIAGYQKNSIPEIRPQNYPLEP